MSLNTNPKGLFMRGWTSGLLLPKMEEGAVGIVSELEVRDIFLL
jgi:hypothetical protein